MPFHNTAIVLQSMHTKYTVALFEIGKEQRYITVIVLLVYLAFS